LHLGNKSQIEFESQAKANEYPPIEKFTSKIYSLNSTSGYVNLSGCVKEVLGKTSFTRNDSSDGTVMRFTLVDDSGKVAVVVWNEKASELENTLKANAHLLLVNAKVKDNQNGSVELQHIRQRSIHRIGVYENRRFS
jgi:DNA polymerase III alpha subunit